MKSGMKIFGAVAFGAAVGTIAGILLAPRSGKETRQFISEKGGEVKDTLSKTVESVLDEVKSSYAALASKAEDKAEESTNKIKHNIN